MSSRPLTFYIRKSVASTIRQLHTYQSISEIRNFRIYIHSLVIRPSRRLASNLSKFYLALILFMIYWCTKISRIIEHKITRIIDLVSSYVFDSISHFIRASLTDKKLVLTHPPPPYLSHRPEYLLSEYRVIIYLLSLPPQPE